MKIQLAVPLKQFGGWMNRHVTEWRKQFISTGELILKCDKLINKCDAHTTIFVRNINLAPSWPGIEC